jgi:hypothetical protein
VQRLDFDLPMRELLPMGPGWARHWLFPFLLGAVVLSLAVKKTLGIV